MTKGLWVSHVEDLEDGHQRVVLSNGDYLCGVMGSPNEADRRVRVKGHGGQLSFVEISVAVRHGLDKMDWKWNRDG